jgi:hypothetical protein
MSVPNLALAVEPVESGNIVFLPMTPKTSTGKARGRVLLRLSITNNEAKAILVTFINVSFPGSAPTWGLRQINQMVNSGDTLLWWAQNPSDDMLFDLPGPDQIQLKIWADGFSEPKSFTYKLVPHRSPVSEGAYLFPAKAADLAFGEFWSINGCIHGTGDEGSQSFGYDMGVMGVDPETGLFSDNIPGTDGTANLHKRIFGKPIYAMADGIVLHALNECPNNLWPLTWEKEEELKRKSDEQRINNWERYNNADDFGGAGNHFYIQHNDEVVLYAHMQKGTLTPSLLKKGAVVKAGDKLGLAGNSGASSGPHTHIHAIQGTKPEVGPLRPIILKDCWMIDNDLIIESAQKGTWAKANHSGISEGSSMDWRKGDVFLSPSARQPDYPEVVKHHVNETGYQTLVNDFFGRGFKPVWLQAYTYMGQTYFNVIFRPAGESAWKSHHGLGSDEYQAAYNLWVKDNGFRIANVCTYWSHAMNKIAYAVLFEKKSGPPQMAYHGKIQAEHKALFDDWTAPAKGFVATQISVVSVVGIRWYTGVYEKKTVVGGWELKTTLSAEEYQQKWNENAGFNRGLVGLHTYTHLNQANFVGLWYGGELPKGNHHLDASSFEKELVMARKNNLYLRGLCGYTRNLLPAYAAFWSRAK